MSYLKFLIVFSVASFHFAVVADAKACQLFLKQGQLFTSFWQEPVCKLSAIVSLHAFNEIGKALDDMPEKDGRGTGAVFRKGLKVAEAAVFIKKGVLEPLGRFLLPYDTDLWNKLNVDLYPLAGVFHLFIGFWGVFGVGSFTAMAFCFRRKWYSPEMERL